MKQYGGDKVKNKLVEYRKQLKLKQREIAKILGISRSFYALIEIGLRNPDYALAKKIAAIFNTDIETIFFNADDFKLKQTKDRLKGA